MAGQQLRLPHGGAQAVEPQQDGRVLRRGEKMRLALLALRVVLCSRRPSPSSPRKRTVCTRLVQHVGADEAADEVQHGAERLAQRAVRRLRAQQQLSLQRVDAAAEGDARVRLRNKNIAAAGGSMCSGFSANDAPSGVR